MNYNNIYERIKPWIKDISEVIKKNNKFGDEVTVGGQIETIIDWEEIYNVDSKMKVPVPYVDLYIDDGIGKMIIRLPKEYYLELMESSPLEKHMLISAIGRLYKNEVSKEEATSPIVWCWKVNIIDGGV